MNHKRALLTGHFSTVGDTECLDRVRHWLNDIGVAYDVAPFSKSVVAKMDGTSLLTEVDPEAYTHLVMICGPVWEAQLEELGFDISRFDHCLRIAVNLSLIDPLDSWNPFDVLLERDSSRVVRPDLTLLSNPATVPVVGRCMVRRQSSYAGRERHEEARQVFDDLIRRHDFAALDVDTRWYKDNNGLTSPAHFLSALQRLDLLLTKRLHGMVFALKAGVPVIAIDSVDGGAKVSAQAEVLGWPQCIPIECATPERLDKAVRWCLSSDAREVVLGCREGTLEELRGIRSQFLTAMSTAPA